MPGVLKTSDIFISSIANFFEKVIQKYVEMMMGWGKIRNFFLDSFQELRYNPRKSSGLVKLAGLEKYIFKAGALNGNFEQNY